MKINPPTRESVEKAMALSRNEAELLFSRMGAKLNRRLRDGTFNPVEIVAIQLELEEEQLREWRSNFAKLKEKYKDPH
jgi:hypothetical protein